MGRPFLHRLAAAAGLLLCLAPSVSAQYFGRNKVQYDREEVLVLATEHFDIYYAQEDAAAAAIAGRLAERWHARLSARLEHTLRGRQPIVLYGSHRRFEQTNVYSGLIDESTGGFTESRKRRIVLPFAKSLAETDHVLGHEIVHAFQFDIADQHGSPLGVPLWFIEGMAEYLTLGPDDPQTSMWMRDAVQGARLPSLRELGSPKYFPYRWGAAVWSHLTSVYGDRLPAEALRARRDAVRRLEHLTGRTADELTASWHAALREVHGPTARAAAPLGAPLISNRERGGRLNLAASLSPDGRRVIYLSERDQFSIDLYLADAATGRVIRKLITTAANAEFESLQYLHSAGAWDPAGARFALATIAEGRPSLVVIGIDRESEGMHLPLPQVDEVFSPTWSPDGTAVAFSAMKGGVSDLFVVDLRTSAVRQLTADAYADIQPSWSPDGRTLAFATDRFTTDLPRLAVGRFRIGLLDVDSGRIDPAPALAGANQLDPAWSPAGTSLYFVSDPGARTNVYRMDRESGRFFQITDVATGVSGVTRVSPVLSVSSGTGALAFSVFRRSGYEVHTITAPDRLAGVELDAQRPIAGLPLVPGTRVVLAAAGDGVEPVPPLPARAALVRPRQSPYRPRLSLEAVGSPYFSAGGGPLGSYVAGGASLLFGDLLGDQQLLTSLHISSRLDESAIAALYVNRRHRWNWGVALEQTPELRLRTNSSRIDPERDRVVTRERERMVWTNRHLGLMAAYPFNRTQRVEVSAGFRQISFSRERRTEFLSRATGRLVEHETEPLPSEPSIGLADVGAALVGDTAIFGATGPMLGTRYRLQAGANAGGLSYLNVLADYRRYLMPVRPYTVALRVLHAGRYGADGNDVRLRDTYLGSSSLVRGYGPSSVARSDCPDGYADCATLNTLLANRIVAIKAEVRVPLWSTLARTSRVRYGRVPLDAFVFADAGAGWGGEKRFGTGGSDGRWMRSFGAGVRTNVLGLVFELAAVRPLDLRAQGWTFGFNLRPGF